MKNSIIFIFLPVFLYTCRGPSGPLPILGELTLENGVEKQHTVPQFSLINQRGETVTNEDFKDDIYMVDYFFISCPAICPKVKRQMLRIYEEYKNTPGVKLVSISMDPKRDTPEKLKAYAEKLGVDHDKWIFLTGDKDHILDMSDAFFIVAYEDKEAPGGFDHSGKIVLIDKNSHIRAFAEGTDPESVTSFIPQVGQLLDEYK